ncbi:MAG: hypothetical protein K9G65_05575 [Rickettsiaceae bacterium]|nr:hypothetical protein [Rickettsiaceae bacterium]
MKDFNLCYKDLKVAANAVKETHWKLSGNLESGQGSKEMYAKLVQVGCTRYHDDWQKFIEDLTFDASQRGYNTKQVLANFPEPALPQETVTVGETGDWVSLDG